MNYDYKFFIMYFLYLVYQGFILNLGKLSEMIIFGPLSAPKAEFFEAAGAVAKIGFSLK